jgi:hypothetical protein
MSKYTYDWKLLSISALIGGLLAVAVCVAFVAFYT